MLKRKEERGRGFLTKRKDNVKMLLEKHSSTNFVMVVEDLRFGKSPAVNFVKMMFVSKIVISSDMQEFS
jgi:hypothetical protein